MSSTTRENALSTVQQKSAELSTAHAQASAQYEIESAITVAIRYPRHEDDARQNLMNSCHRPTFAEKASYRIPRGGTTIEGPSSQMAREAARVWGNIRYGFEIVRDDEEMIHIRGFAWDVQTNARATQDASFKKLIQRRNKRTGTTDWVAPDERDLRELINKHGAIAERNCILKLIPSDMIEDAMNKAHRTRAKGVSADPAEAKKKIVGSFGSLSISASELESYLGCKLAQASDHQIRELREIYASIRDGASTWADYLEDTTAKRQSYAEKRAKAATTDAPAPTVDEGELTDAEIAAMEREE